MAKERDAVGKGQAGKHSSWMADFTKYFPPKDVEKEDTLDFSLFPEQSVDAMRAQKE
ncbi:hypothetical protein HK101_007965 [Irineochytrium annulatum]|nr:hypothetical protein HK101_007965 [Irineochytrium annulatum]